MSERRPPHLDIVLHDLSDTTVERLAAAFDPPQPNPGRSSWAERESARDGSTVEPGRYIIVGDHDADSAVAQVVEVKPNGIVLLKVLPGHADTHAELLATRPA